MKKEVWGHHEVIALLCDLLREEQIICVHGTHSHSGNGIMEGGIKSCFFPLCMLSGLMRSEENTL